MSNFYYVKLSCPKRSDDGKFLSLLQNIRKIQAFKYTLENIPFQLKHAKTNDFIFVHIGGDENDKKKYFRENKELIDYETGLQYYGKIIDINSKEKEVFIEITSLTSVVSKEDLYFFPQFINNVGATTKGSQNQAGLYLLEENVGLGLIEYFYKKNLIDRTSRLFDDLQFEGRLFEYAVKEFKEGFTENPLTKIVLNEINRTQSHSVYKSDQLIKEFITWFNLPENFKGSYEGIVNVANLKFWNATYFNNKLFSITKTNEEDAFEEIKNIVENESPDWIKFNNSSSKGAPKAVLGSNNYLRFLKSYLKKYSFLIQNRDNFKILNFQLDCKESGLNYSKPLITRYVASLATKPFVLLSGLSGSGKTKLAQSFSQWICEDNSQYCILPVGADWTNREPLLGYVNALNNSEYILPENGALQLILRANENQEKPYFLILDEMNLSHVERYFADFLSIMESSDKFKLHSNESPLDGGNDIKVAKEYSWPANLFVVGTVNIDETTYMFSPKVLDRANVIEFRVEKAEMIKFLSESKAVTDLNGEGAGMAESFVNITNEKVESNPKELKDTLENFFEQLQVIDAEFGYRTASEIQTLFGKIDLINPSYSDKTNEKIDIAIMQKLLPKLHGSRTKLVSVLRLLAKLCLEKEDIDTDKLDKIFEIVKTDALEIKYPISYKKIESMYNNVIANGFTSYAEA